MQAVGQPSQTPQEAGYWGDHESIDQHDHMSPLPSTPPQIIVAAPKEAKSGAVPLVGIDVGRESKMEEVENRNGSSTPSAASSPLPSSLQTNQPQPHSQQTTSPSIPLASPTSAGFKGLHVQTRKRAVLTPLKTGHGAPLVSTTLLDDQLGQESPMYEGSPSPGATPSGYSPSPFPLTPHIQRSALHPSHKRSMTPVDLRRLTQSRKIPPLASNKHLPPLDATNSSLDTRPSSKIPPMASGSSIFSTSAPLRKVSKPIGSSDTPSNGMGKVVLRGDRDRKMATALSDGKVEEKESKENIRDTDIVGNEKGAFDPPAASHEEEKQKELDDRRESTEEESRLLTALSHTSVVDDLPKPLIRDQQMEEEAEERGSIRVLKRRETGKEREREKGAVSSVTTCLSRMGKARRDSDPHMTSQTLTRSSSLSRTREAPSTDITPPSLADRMSVKLDVFVGTWNLHAKDPPEDLLPFIPKDNQDIYVLGTEECEHSIQKSFLFRSKEKWVRKLDEHLGHEYIPLAEETLQAMHIIVFVRKDLLPHISNVQTDSVATGLADLIGNKGGVAVSFLFGNTSMLFVNCHFAAHQNNVKHRNADFHKINSRLMLSPLLPTEGDEQANVNGSVPLGKDKGVVRPVVTAHKSKKKRLRLGKTLYCTDQYDVVIWAGDLNYRVNGNRRAVDALVRLGMYDVMKVNDQLMQEMMKGHVFAGFSEAPITFVPTYKYDAGKDRFDSSAKQRIPSWTDRVLYKVSPLVKVKKYDSVMSIRTSDHRPVYATFDITTKLKRSLSTVSLLRKEQLVNDTVEEDELSSSKSSSICAIM